MRESQHVVTSTKQSKANQIKANQSRPAMERPTSETGSKLGLQMPPGFRFHPTDEELVVHYLAKRSDISFGVKLMAEIDLYKHNPWELPDLAYVGEKEWYFLTPRDRKYPNGARPNRAAASGYWKATGTDKPIYEQKSGSLVGIKKALVFYQGKATQGVKTNWIMHEYRLPESDKARRNTSSNSKPGSLRMDDFVLCRIYEKASSTLKATNALPKITIMVKDSIPFEDIFDYVPDQLVKEPGFDNRMDNCSSTYNDISEQLESSFAEQDFSSSQSIAAATMQSQNGYDRLKRGIDSILQHKNASNKCSTPTKRFRII